ncbi:MAG: hypothetical protein E7422_01200 [Ruminococcaceae bacterium]|jgi:hypothetical protein|nr:hypothetical protein [Oscillospiraceae bacterium]
MKRGTLLGLTAVLAAGAYAAVKLLGQDRAQEAPAAPEPKPEPERPAAPTDADKTVAYPLKNKYTHHSDGAAEPTYIFELETPSGTKELTVTWAHYETYYIGDEVICTETDKGLEVV